MVASVSLTQEMGFGMTREMIGSIVDYLSTVGRENPFNGQPGYKWWKGFLQRFHELVDRKLQHLPKHRATKRLFTDSLLRSVTCSSH